jgi:parvulin-like peptidyl-prolyl isomerase
MNPSLLLAIRLSLAAVLVPVCACQDPEVLATVGDTDIRRADVEYAASQRSPAARLEPTAQLEVLITRELLAEEARRQSLEEDRTVRAQLASAEREVLAKALLDKTLKQAHTEEALRQRYAEQKESLSRRQVHVRHLMVPLSSPLSAEARHTAQARINLLHARLVGGESFDTVAQEVTVAGDSGVQAQELGAVREGQVHPVFFDAAAALKQHEFSQPVETPFGLHIIQALAPPETVLPSFEEVRGQLAAEARREAEAKLVAGLRERIRVERHPERLDGGTGTVTRASADAGVKP